MGWQGYDGKGDIEGGEETPAERGLWHELKDLRAKLERAWAALGTTETECADDPETADLADSICISLEHERVKAEMASEKITQERDQARAELHEQVKQCERHQDAAHASAKLNRERADTQETRAEAAERRVEQLEKAGRAIIDAFSGVDKPTWPVDGRLLRGLILAVKGIEDTGDESRVHRCSPKVPK